MPRPDALAIHATAVAIDGWALIIRGASGSGKSSLAAALLAGARAGQTVELIGDDRVLLAASPGGALVAHPHPRIAGFLERRGLGLVAVPFCFRAPVAALVDLGRTAAPPAALAGFPALVLAGRDTAASRARRVAAWWDAVATDGPDGAAVRPHRPEKRGEMRC